MISVSNAYKTAIIETSRRFVVQLVVDGNILDCDIDNIKCYKGSCGNELSIGSVYASYLEVVLKRCSANLSNKVITYKVGLMVNGAYEYVTMGKYTVLDPKDSNGTISFTAVSTLSLIGQQNYTTSLTYPTTINAVISELQTKTGTTITLKGLSGTGAIQKALTGLNRDALGTIGCLLGGFVTEDNSGNIVITKYNSGETAPIAPYRCISLPEFATNPYLIAGVHITVTPASDGVPEVYFEHGTPMIIQACEWMTQALFNAMYPNVEGLQFDMAKVQISLGDPRLEPWDTIEVTDLKGNTYNVPCFEIVHTFNGGFETEITAQIEKTDQASKNVKGALSKVVERLDGDVMAAAVAATQAKAQAQNAADAAQEAWDHADAAKTSAEEADRQAGIATDNANEAIRQAGIATTNANEAIRQAGLATTSANEAKEQAHTATTYANSALDQLGIVQDVIGVLNWATEHGTFTRTSDTTIQEGKVYFTYDSQTGDYTPVVTPEASQLSNYYELTVDEAMESFIMSHLAVTSRGLWVLPNGYGTATNAQYAPNYKVLLASDGLYIYDDDGVLVSKFGENIEFSSTRQQTIGNNQAYIVFDPEAASGQGTLTIGGATIVLSGKTLEEVLAEKLDSVDVSVTQTSTGADITVNGDTVSISNGKEGAMIWTTSTAPTGSYTFNISSLSGPTGETPKVGDLIVYSYYRYTITSVSSATVTAGSRTSIRGATGASSKWYSGTGITGTSTTATVFPNSGVSSAVVGDMYLNTSTGNTYRCTTAGAASAAKWVYTSNVTGPQGVQGPQGDQGPKGDQGPQGVSVTSLTPYYQLGTSKPAKPSDNTQPTGWSTTQPVVDTTKTCYVTVQAIYSNGDIKYSDVSTLSEYEASKSVIELSLVNSASVNGAWYYQYSPTVSGAIASFKAIGGNAINSIVSNIDVVQSGSGDPSPTNVRALSGRSTIYIYHSGKNLLKNKRQAGETFVAGDVTFAIQRDGRVVVNGAAGDTNKYMAINNSYRIPATTILTGCPSGGSSTTYEIQVANNGYTTKRDYGSGVEVLPRPAPDIYLYVRSNYVANNLTFAPMLRLEGTDPTYEPFIGSVSQIPLGQTVYKGTFDATNGTLTVTHKLFNVNFAGATGTQAGGSSTNYKGFYSAVLPGVKKPGNTEVPDMYCNRFKVTSRQANYNNTEGIAIHQTEGRAYVYSTVVSSMTLAEAQAWLEENPIQVVYPLETPEVYNVDSFQSVALAGDNNIWSSTGDVSVEYIIDVTYDGSEYYYILGSEKTVVDPSDLDKDGDTLVTVYRDGLGDRINNVQNDVIKAQSTADEASAKAEDANSRADEISSAFDDYRDTNDAAIGVLRERLTLEESVSSELESRTDKAEAYITALQNSYDKYDSFIEISPSVPSIALGKRNDDSVKSKVEITGTSVNIWSEDKITAYASGQAFNAPEGVFENVTMVNANGSGNLRWIARSNGHLSLKVVK